MMMFSLILFFQATGLSPRMTAIAVAVFTIVAAVASAYHFNWSRARGVIGAIVAAYGMITPFVSSFPRGVGIVIALIGVVATLTAERVQGGVSDPAKVAAAANGSRNELR